MLKLFILVIFLYPLLYMCITFFCTIICIIVCFERMIIDIIVLTKKHMYYFWMTSLIGGSKLSTFLHLHLYKKTDHMFRQKEKQITDGLTYHFLQMDLNRREYNQLSPNISTTTTKSLRCPIRSSPNKLGAAPRKRAGCRLKSTK